MASDRDRAGGPLAPVRAAFARQDYDGALAALDRALSAEPARVELWMSLAELQHHLGRDREARAAVGRALALAPDHASALLLSAVLDNTLGDAVRGERTLRELLRRQPHHGAARANLASLLERGNRFAEAEREARDGLKDAPYEPLLNHVVAQCALHRGDLDTCALYLERLRVALEREPRHAIGPMPQHAAYLAAQLLQARGRHDEAFAAFVEANRIAAANAARRGVDGRAFLAEAAAEAAVLDGAADADRPALDEPAPLPFRPAFLVGFPRSGTTLLEQILDAHPDIVSLEEKGCFEEVLDLLPGGYPTGLARVAAVDRERVRAAYAARVLEHLPVAAGKLMVDKLPLRLTRAGAIHLLLPEARFIFALRHPYDAVLSCFMQEFGANSAMANCFTLEDAAAMYHRTMSLWSRYREQYPLAVVTVRYEALVDDLAREVRPVLEHLGVPWDARVEGFAEHALARGRIRTPSYSQVRRGLYTQARGRHLAYLPHFAPAVRALLDPWVARWGYAATGP